MKYKHQPELTPAEYAKALQQAETKLPAIVIIATALAVGMSTLVSSLNNLFN